MSNKLVPLGTPRQVPPVLPSLARVPALPQEGEGMLQTTPRSPGNHGAIFSSGSFCSSSQSSLQAARMPPAATLSPRLPSLPNGGADSDRLLRGSTGDAATSVFAAVGVGRAFEDDPVFIPSVPPRLSFVPAGVSPERGPTRNIMSPLFGDAVFLSPMPSGNPSPQPTPRGSTLGVQQPQQISGAAANGGSVFSPRAPRKLSPAVAAALSPSVAPITSSLQPGFLPMLSPRGV